MESLTERTSTSWAGSTDIRWTGRVHCHVLPHSLELCHPEVGRVYLPLCKVADTPFQLRGDALYDISNSGFPRDPHIFLTYQIGATGAVSSMTSLHQKPGMLWKYYLEIWSWTFYLTWPLKRYKLWRTIFFNYHTGLIRLFPINLNTYKLCYGSTTIENIFTFTVRELTLHVRIWHLQTPDSDI